MYVSSDHRADICWADIDLYFLLNEYLEFSLCSKTSWGYMVYGLSAPCLFGVYSYRVFICAPVLTGTFTGHLGDATVEHTAYHLPIIVKESLEQAMSTSSASKLGIQTVSELLSRSITSFDEAIAGDVLELFPGGVDSLPGRSNDEIRSVVNDYSNGGENYQKAKLAMYGTTALIALVDPEHTNLWIANLGDCEAGTFTLLMSDDAVRLFTFSQYW